MLPRLAALLLAATALRACASYEYEHEIWLRVDGSGTINVTGRPALWTAFKSLPLDPQGDPEVLKRTARELLTYAFAADVLETIELAEVREGLEAATLRRYTAH